MNLNDELEAQRDQHRSDVSDAMGQVEMANNTACSLSCPTAAQVDAVIRHVRIEAGTSLGCFSRREIEMAIRMSWNLSRHDTTK